LPLSLFVVAPSALLTDHQPHGDGLVAYGFIREMASRGHELHVAAQRVDLREPAPARVHIHLLRDPTRTPAPRDRAGAMWRMRRLFQRLGGPARFDLAHQLNPVDAGLSLALADQPVPMVLGPYVPDWPRSGPGSVEAPSSGPRAVKRALRAAQQRRARLVLLSTEAAETKLARRRTPSTLVRVVPPGIDDALWSPGRPQEPREPIVLFLANLRIRKGVMVLLEAFDRLATRQPEVRLRIGGAGPLEDEVRRRVAASPVRDRIEMLGHVERADAPAVVRDGDIFCAPSYAEPFGLSALEAMACARPVVATDAGGLRHLVDRSGGRLVRPGDAAGLATALGELLDDPELRSRMGAHNRTVVEARFSWTRVGDRLEAAYAEALDGPGPVREASRSRAAALSA
jgi:glycosyltransferase involved in cell wall biosynthesis